MPLSVCNTTVDSTQREMLEHGSVMFPIAWYHDDLSQGEVPWHWHEELEAVVVAQGSCIVMAGKEKYLIREGEGFFVNSGILHGCWDWENSACRFHSLVFHPRLVGGSLDSVFYQEYVQPVIGNPMMQSLHLTQTVFWKKEALELIERAWQAGQQESFGYEFRVREALSEMMLRLRRNLPSEQKKPGIKAVRDGERIKRMIQFIHDHYGEQLSIQSIAAAAAVSESECLRCFRSTVGLSPIQYVRQYRIQKAAQLLNTTQEPVCAIAERCGFQDFSYFTKTFREMKGCVPTEYRKNSQQ